jgi:hypothetical protein
VRKNNFSQAGLFNPRVLLAFALCSVGTFLAMLSFAATAPRRIDQQAGPLSSSATMAAAGGWSIVPSPSVSGAQYNLLNGATCVSASDCWAVGYYAGNSFQTLIEHWDGSSWAIVASPNSSATQFNFLNAVSCVSASDCWAAGYYQSGLLSTQTLIEHWDGTSWVIVTSPDAAPTAQNYLNNVTCISASECWAVGYYQTDPTTFQTLIERWDGSSWAIATSPNTTPTRTNLLSDVKCVSASNCWAVGYYDSSSTTSNAYQTLIERWDGSSWTIISSANTISAEDNILFGVTCSSASDCWAVGHARLAIASQTLIERWNGTSWTVVTSPSSSPTQNNYLFTVTCSSGSDCWAVGYYDAGNVAAGPRYQTLIERWDGTSWTIVTSPNTSPAQDNFLFGLTYSSPSDCWAVGYYDLGNGATQTVMLRYAANLPTPTRAVSRKTHGTAGTFDINLPLVGNAGIECRGGGSTNDYQMNITFPNVVTCHNAQVTTGTGSVSSFAVSGDGTQVMVNLTGVSDAQRIVVTLNVSDGTNTGDVPIPMGVLVGDTNDNGTVSNADVSSIQAQVGAPVGQSNFRMDVNANGTLSNADAATAQAQVGAQLP